MVFTFSMKICQALQHSRNRISSSEIVFFITVLDMAVEWIFEEVNIKFNVNR